MDEQVGEIIFDKSRKNLKKIYNKINSKNLNRYVRINKEEVSFLAIGGYNRTYELLLAMGAKPDEIATFSNLNLTQMFINETHGKKILYIKKINYVTNTGKNWDFTTKRLDLNVADGFEESMLVYENAARTVGLGKNKEEWDKPKIVILDDQSLNLQFEGYRFRHETRIGFVQMRNRNADPQKIVDEIKEVEEAKKMMFAMYQQAGTDEPEILDGLNRLRESVHLKLGEDWAMKPTDFKRVVGSQILANRLKEMNETGITQLKSNKKIGTENARWVIIPESAFEFKGFDYKDEEDAFNDELALEEQSEQQYIEKQERMLNSILSIELPINIKQGYVGSEMRSSVVTLQSFLDDIDDIENEKIHGIELLEGATTEEEYKHIKKYSLAYFLDGNYKNSERKDDNYLGGRRLISIDVDDGEYTREKLEEKLEAQSLFGLIFPTAKYYFNKSKRWRIVLMADEEMTKEKYRATVNGVANMLELEIDEASKKVSQLMGYPMSKSDVSIVTGTTVSVAQFYQEPRTSRKNIFPIRSSKSLVDFEHSQARLMKQALENGVGEGKRNETYRQIYMFLCDTLNNPDMEPWYGEAEELIEKTKERALLDGLPEKEVEVIYR